jgi:hypothetical protein
LGKGCESGCERGRRWRQVQRLNHWLSLGLSPWGDGQNSLWLCTRVGFEFVEHIGRFE